jgi:hypothetical protein
VPDALGPGGPATPPPGQWPGGEAALEAPAAAALCAGGQDGAAPASGGDVQHRIVFGTLGAVQQVLAGHGWQSNTACIARLTLTIRQHVAAVGRRGSTLCKGADGVRQQLAWYPVYDTFCLPHASGHHPLRQAEPTHGTGSAKRWQPRPPALAAGLTDHVWTLREVLLVRVPPWQQPAQG